ncbi:MAG: division/cell wall cluster transcriptional repressor MraZ [Erysipelotrichaceae bacterium]|nr:division/cell wall cluster transcriptional repressor MraZ [Erysipelotrichaceae bacterium]MBQ1522117.1 division/cell wall cluster transcriptional repressor MraZ [Erysipelotrichaceae bacterium]MBQ3384978.1 division/cell wall cluster transcriptional repressor MraZ [Erysipelotrichaceae bacterium]
MFLGEYRNKMDAKGRIAVPAKFRGELGDSVIINRYYNDGCLAIFREDAWIEKYTPVISRPDNRKDARMMNRIITSTAQNTQFDGQGRILVPSSLIKMVSLEKNCVFIGAGDHVELWPEEAWDRLNAGLTDEEIERITENV